MIHPITKAVNKSGQTKILLSIGLSGHADAPSYLA